jgi:DNA-binding Lrp family transcriptional regulator
MDDLAKDALIIDNIDRDIINQLQRGFPLVEEPYKLAAAQLGIDETELLSRLQTLLDEGVLTRFGPMYHAERMGGGLSLAAMQIPAEDFERVAGIVNSFEQVAHNYARDHALNMWFVVATETAAEVDEVIAAIASQTAYPVYNMPKEREFFVGLHFAV